mgnify:CR=1 FL=1
MDYKIKSPPPPDADQVTVEVHGDSTLVVPTKTDKKFANLTRAGGGRGKQCRGWTAASRKALRVRLADHQSEFKSHLALKFPLGSGRDPQRLHDMQRKLFRWVRNHLTKRYVAKVEFSGHALDLHWHLALDMVPTEDQKRELQAYVEKFNLVATVTTPKPVTIASYLAKKDQTENPKWFASGAFKPWSCTFPKPPVERVKMEREKAVKDGIIHPRFSLCYGGAEKVSASMSLTGDISEESPMSLTSDIAPDGTTFTGKGECRRWRTKWLGGETVEITHWAEGGMVEVETAKTATESYQSKCCVTCWNRYGRAISRLAGATFCDMCGNPWEPAATAPESRENTFLVVGSGNRVEG